MATATVPAISQDHRMNQAHRNYERWILPHHDVLRSHAYRLTGNRTDAEDLLQETLVRAYTRLHHLTNSSAARAWLYTILLNLFRSRYRHARILPLRTATSSEEIMAEIPAPAKPPEAEVLEQAQYQAVLRALSRLPSIYRVPVYLADVEERSYDDIAAYLNIPVGTVRSRINRGRQRLRASLYAWQN